MRRLNRRQQRAPRHRNRAKLKISQLVRVILYLLLKFGMLAVAWRRNKNAIFFLPCSISFKEKVDEMLRIILNRPPGDKMEGFDKNALVWGIFMPSSLPAANFLEKDYSENLLSIRNTGQKPTVRILFDVTQKIHPRTRIGDLGSVTIELA